MGKSGLGLTPLSTHLPIHNFPGHYQYKGLFKGNLNIKKYKHCPTFELSYYNIRHFPNTLFLTHWVKEGFRGVPYDGAVVLFQASRHWSSGCGRRLPTRASVRTASGSVRFLSSSLRTLCTSKWVTYCTTDTKRHSSSIIDFINRIRYYKYRKLIVSSAPCLTDLEITNYLVIVLV